MEAANALFCFGPLAAASLPVFLEWEKSSEDDIRELGVKGLYYIGRGFAEASKVLSAISRNPNDPWHNSVSFWLKEST
jgi:hypothetical protein